MYLRSSSALETPERHEWEGTTEKQSCQQERSVQPRVQGPYCWDSEVNLSSRVFILRRLWYVRGTTHILVGTRLVGL